MSSKSKDKGSRFERDIVNRHHEEGITAKKVPLSGAVDGYKGDVEIQYPSFGKPTIGECKSRKNGEGFITLEKWIKDCDILFLRRDRQEPMVVMPWKLYNAFLRAFSEFAINEEIRRMAEQKRIGY